VLLVTSTVSVLLLVGMLVRLQVVEPERYVQKGEGQRQIRTSLVGLRGSIVDRNGETLAMSLPARAVTADPRYVTNPPAEAAELARVLGLDAAMIEAKLERPDTGFVYVARQLDADVGEAVEKLRLPGVYVTDESRRVTAADGLGRSVVGRMNVFGDEASYGLEKSLDPILTGHDGLRVHERGADGATIVGSEHVERPASPGRDVTLTLDRSLQFLAETALEEQVAKVQGATGTAIVGRPATGEILAMASVVSADGEVRPSILNGAVRTYEPGSVMKLVTAAAGFEHHVVQPDTVLTVPSSIKVADRTVHDAEHHPTEPMSVQEIIAQSSNVGTIKVAQLTGRKAIVDMLDRFGFGKMTALGLQKEQAGQFRRKWFGSDIGSIPIGQSITATPLQIWNAYNTIANRGMYVEPRLVESITDARGDVITTPHRAPRRVVSAETATKVTQALERVIEDGTGKEWSIPGYHVAAKTGTAYEPVGGGVKGYGSGGNRHYAATFAGFFPASDPQLSIVVMIDDPKVDYFGATAAGPVFDRLAKESMRRYGIAGDDPVPQAPGTPLRARAAQTTTTTTTTTVAPTTTVPGTVGVASPAGAALVADPQPDGSDPSRTTGRAASG
jgi:cell division protein FtsI (penicillin-binding protein 3)